MSEYIRKSHNVSVLLYHFVCPAKYRRIVFDNRVDEVLKKACLEISRRYEIYFVEIGTDQDHVHFLIQSVPTYSPTRIIQTVKSITAKIVFAEAPHIKQQLWGGEFWTDGFFVSSVGQKGNEVSVSEYVRNQGKDYIYKQLFRQQLRLL